MGLVEYVHLHVVCSQTDTWIKLLLICSGTEIAFESIQTTPCANSSSSDTKICGQRGVYLNNCESTMYHFQFGRTLWEISHGTSKK